MTFIRRTNYDMNDIHITCRAMENPILTYVKAPDGVVNPKVEFVAITNSSPFSSRTSCKFYIVAMGRRAERINAMVKKGYGLYIHGELTEAVEKVHEKSMKQTTIYKYNTIKVEHIHIISVPNLEANNETVADVFYGLETESGE